jgi:hypothetical protein
MRRSALLVLPSLALGCVSSTETPSDLAGAPVDQASTRDLVGVVQDLASAMDLSVPGGDLASQYPPGPYGNSVGSVFPLLLWEGYLVPAADQVATNEPYGPYSSDQLRRSGAPYALLHVSEVD